MKNVTLAVEEEILQAARKLALDRNTTVNKLVREYLKRLVEEDSRRELALERLGRLMKDGIVEVGEKSWKRTDLHDR